MDNFVLKMNTGNSTNVVADLDDDFSGVVKNVVELTITAGVLEFGADSNVDVCIYAKDTQVEVTFEINTREDNGIICFKTITERVPTCSVIHEDGTLRFILPVFTADPGVICKANREIYTFIESYE